MGFLGHVRGALWGLANPRVLETRNAVSPNRALLLEVNESLSTVRTKASPTLSLPATTQGCGGRQTSLHEPIPEDSPLKQGDLREPGKTTIPPISILPCACVVAMSFKYHRPMPCRGPQILKISAIDTLLRCLQILPPSRTVTRYPEKYQKKVKATEKWKVGKSTRKAGKE